MDGKFSYSENIFGELYQVATRVEMSINNLVHKIENLIEATSDYRVNVLYASKRRGEITRNYSRIDKIVKMLGFKPDFTLERGLTDTWNYFINRTSKV